MLERHHAAVRRELERWRGREIDTAGDGFLAAFDGPARAISYACAVREAVLPLGLEIRAGLHTGECEVLGEKLAGVAVHIGARRAPRLPIPEMCSSQAPSKTSSRARGSRLTNAASTTSRACRERGGSTRSRPPKLPGGNSPLPRLAACLLKLHLSELAVVRRGPVSTLGAVTRVPVLGPARSADGRRRRGLVPLLAGLDALMTPSAVTDASRHEGAMVFAWRWGCAASTAIWPTCFLRLGGGHLGKGRYPLPGGDAVANLARSRCSPSYTEVEGAPGTGTWSRPNCASAGTTRSPSTFRVRTRRPAGGNTPTRSGQAIGNGGDVVVVVGHSLGGFTAPLVGARNPVDQLVLVAAMIPSPGELFADWWANTGYEASGYDDVFYHDVPPALAAEAKSRERDETSKALREPWPLEAWPDTPTRYLLCRDDRMFSAAWARRHARDRLGIDPDEMDGGHYISLSRPSELTDRLVSYAAETR